MAVNIPTFQEIYDKTVNELTLSINAGESDKSKQINPLKENFVKGLVESTTVGAYTNYLIAQEIFKNLFPQTADDDYTLAWGSIFGVVRKVATLSSGNIAFTGVVGGSIPIGTVVSTSTGLEYTTQASTNILSQTQSISSLVRSGSTVTVTTPTNHNLATGIEMTISGAVETDYNGTFTIIVTSQTTFIYTIETTPTTPATGSPMWSADYVKVNIQASGYSSDYNLSGGSIVSLGNSIANVDDNAKVLFNGITGGIDQETITDYRTRVLEKTRNNATGFSDSNIKFFITNNFNTITRVWVFGASALTKAVGVSSISSNADGVATAVLSSSISFLNGTTITISGANESALNLSTQAIETANNKIVYNLDTASSLSGTGTIIMSYSDVEGGKTKIYFTTDNESNIIPTPSLLNSVKQAIIGNTVGIEGILPAEMADNNCYVLAPSAITTNITFSGLSPNTSDMQNAITLSLQNFFKSDNVNVNENVLLDNIKGVVSNTIDNGGNVPTFTLSSPISNISIDSGELATLGTITYP